MKKISTTDEFSKNNENFSDFGRYQLKDKIILNLPDNIITLCDLSDGKFSYTRNSQNETIKKIIQLNPNIHQIELVPVLPVHIPTYKTDFFFIRFEEPLFIAENSIMETLIYFPVEIGLFIVAQNKSSGFDFFSCDSSNSRFSLYGTPEDGNLCKYATTSLDNKCIVSKPFTYTQFRIKIVN